MHEYIYICIYICIGSSSHFPSFPHSNMKRSTEILRMPPGGAVGGVFDANGNAEGALGPYEEEVRAAGDKAVPW